MTGGRPNDRFRRAQIRWRLANPVLRVAAQGGAVAVLAVAAFTFLSNGNAVNETAASVLVAVVFGVATVLQLRQSQRRQHTVELVTSFQSSEVLSAADTWMATRITTRRPIEVDVPAGDERQVIVMLDYYEFLSSLALRGLVDVPLLLGLRGGTMARCHDLCRTYIDDRRANVGSDLYRSFSLFVDEHSRRASKDRRGRIGWRPSRAPSATPEPLADRTGH